MHFHFPVPTNLHFKMHIPIYDETKISVVRLNVNKQKTSDISYFSAVSDSKAFLDENQSNLYHMHIGTHSGIVGLSQSDNLQQCQNLYSIFIPSCVSAISAYAFADSSGLTNLYTAAKTIGNFAFAGCAGLKKAEIRSGTEVLGNQAFVQCENLEEVLLPDDIITIGSYAFTNCVSLHSVNIPKSLTEIPYGMFIRNSSLLSITIPDNIVTIGTAAFLNVLV